jgi:gluconolactonase
MALSPEGDYLYVVESLLPGVIRLPILADGSAGTLEVVLELPESVPDGLAFTADGTLLIACYRPDRIYALNSTGRLSVLADDPLGTDIAAPTNVAFGGADLRSLFIASLGRWHVAELRLNSPGLPLHYPEAPVELLGKL